MLTDRRGTEGSEGKPGLRRYARGTSIMGRPFRSFRHSSSPPLETASLLHSNSEQRHAEAILPPPGLLTRASLDASHAEMVAVLLKSFCQRCDVLDISDTESDIDEEGTSDMARPPAALSVRVAKHEERYGISRVTQVACSKIHTSIANLTCQLERNERERLSLPTVGGDQIIIFSIVDRPPVNITWPRIKPRGSR